MGRKRANEESKSQIFIRIFESNPDLLATSDFSRVAELYEASGAGRQWGEKERSVAANIKSRLRKKRGMKIRRKARKAKLRGAKAEVLQVAPGLMGVMRAARPTSSLLKLEDMVDTCLTMAKQLDPVNLEGVIKQLRIARNKIIQMQGDI